MTNNDIDIRLNEWREIDSEFAQFLETCNKKYWMYDKEKVLNLIVEYDILQRDGIIVLESDKRKEIKNHINGLSLEDERTYGRVIIRLYKLEE